MILTPDDDDDRREEPINNLTEEQRLALMKASLGAISRTSEYTARGMSSPQATKLTTEIADGIANYDDATKLGSDAVQLLAKAGAGLVGGGAIAATAAPLLPIIAVGGLALWAINEISKK